MSKTAPTAVLSYLHFSQGQEPYLYMPEKSAGFPMLGLRRSLRLPLGVVDM